MPPHTEDSKDFSPDQFFDVWAKDATRLQTLHRDNDFRKLIIDAFGLPQDDDYGYSAGPAEVTLEMTQKHIQYGAKGHLLNWYTHNAVRKIHAAMSKQILIASSSVPRQHLAISPPITTSSVRLRARRRH